MLRLDILLCADIVLVSPHPIPRLLPCLRLKSFIMLLTVFLLRCDASLQVAYSSSLLWNLPWNLLVCATWKSGEKRVGYSFVRKVKIFFVTIIVCILIFNVYTMYVLFTFGNAFFIFNLTYDVDYINLYCKFCFNKFNLALFVSLFNSWCWLVIKSGAPIGFALCLMCD